MTATNARAVRAGLRPEDSIVPAGKAVAITASSTAFTATTAVHCNTSGSFTVDFNSGATGISLTLNGGQTYPFSLVKVTSGTGLVALYPG